MTNLVPAERIENKIYLIRGHKIMLAFDLAKLYGVKTKVFNQAAQRNAERFPEDFMFQLTWEEAECLRSQIVTLKNQQKRSKRGQHIKYLPYAFTEQGVAMLSSVLRSKRAIQVNVAIMRAFVKLRQFLSTHKELSRKLFELEQKVGENSSEIRKIFEAIRKLMAPPKKSKKIGFLR
ncbi:MAG: ORF6N domain-containing protein [Candidatus Margulisbacteria bacterium]|nr:ORF6N domain-containing protein [Candidatus Margulisiibacteriota bacterium]MBU1021889.1 ORF6N domain-containing protein [Candidatus Margulisiibacteriota bacterium]MBU1728527.1 ORF6N domain-containing protein [Candidatus Margulisiibacteriota bacterium]MBU1954674.1 ORF6N domain-containing protein [Candidatus Margulisiibacteriota bacterium]